jgi:hypothetical protein
MAAMSGQGDGAACDDAAFLKEAVMATEKKHGNREAKKPKKPVSKTIAAAPSTKDMVGAAVKAANKK